MLKQQKKVEAGQGREKTAQLVEEKKEDDENIELYDIKYVISCSSGSNLSR